MFSSGPTFYLVGILIASSVNQFPAFLSHVRLDLSVTYLLLNRILNMPRIKTILAVALGAAVGGAIVSLLAPQTGNQTRAMLRALLIKRFDNLLAKAERKLEDAYERAVSEQYSPEEPTTERSFF